MGLDTVELVMAFEEEFGVNIPDAAAERMTTPGDVVEWLVAAQERGEFFQPPPPPPKSRWALKHSNWPVPGQARPKLTRHQIAAGVRQRTMDVLGITPEQYRETGRFVQDFGAD